MRKNYNFIVLFIMFLASCTHLNTTNSISAFNGGDYICISLNQFIVDLNDGIINNSITSELDSLFGMSWLDGYIIDDENNDIILIGKCLKNKPVYRAEDIIVNFHNVLDSSFAPYCSLDPNPTNIIKFEKLISEGGFDNFEKNIEKFRDKVGGQKVVIGGIPVYSRHAAIMIYADYDMKKISQGLLKINGIRSGLEIAADEKSIFDLKNSSTMSRYWLHIKENNLINSYPNFKYNEGIVFLNECPVVVLTEKQVIDKEGNLRDAQMFDNNKNAQIFAKEMSENYDTLALQNSLFAELENLFRLQACLQAIRYNNDIENSKLNIDLIKNINLTAGNILPDSLPGLMNYKIVKEEKNKIAYKETSSQLYFVSGGVSQEIKISNKNLSVDNTIVGLKKAILEKRPAKNVSHWDLHIPPPKENKIIKFFEIKK